MLKRYTIKPQSPLDFSRKQAERIDERRNAVRLTGEEVDAVIRLNAAITLLESTVDDLEKLAKRTEIRMFKPTIKNLVKMSVKMAAGIPMTQVRTIEANISNSYVICSSERVPYYTNIRHEHLNEIVKQAAKQCDMECMKTREQSKQCPLRKAFESIPGMKEAARANANDAEHCPYTLMELPDIKE